MKTLVLILGLLTVYGETAQAESFTSGQAAYRAGVEAFENGEFQQASESFIEAIRLAPAPAAESVEYLPYVYLAASSFELGRTRQARDALVQSQVFGIAPATENGAQLIDGYAARIMSAPLDASSVAIMTTPNAVRGRPEPVLEDEVTMTPEQIRSRCSSSALDDGSKLPWYFHYECGIDLMEAGDVHRALAAFRVGANVLEKSRRGKRTYGMWFVDYLPYYQIALAYSRLGDWESAREAIRTSESFGEFSPDDPDYETFTRLERLIASNLGGKDS